MPDNFDYVRMRIESPLLNDLKNTKWNLGYWSRVYRLKFFNFLFTNGYSFDRSQKFDFDYFTYAIDNFDYFYIDENKLIYHFSSRIQWKQFKAGNNKGIAYFETLLRRYKPC